MIHIIMFRPLSKNVDEGQDIDLGEIKKILPSGSKVKLSLSERSKNNYMDHLNQ